jgi:glycine dehydrogenase subunit 2
MIEPTETETKETLERFAAIVRAVLEEAREDPSIAQNAPYSTPVRRLDEGAAARRPVVRQPPRGEDDPPGDPHHPESVSRGAL